jgi:hypothetical protein
VDFKGDWNMKWLLKKFGFYQIEYGFACGRHWIEIDGKVIAQTLGDDIWMRDEDVAKMQKIL